MLNALIARMLQKKSVVIHFGEEDGIFKGRIDFIEKPHDKPTTGPSEDVPKIEPEKEEKKSSSGWQLLKLASAAAAGSFAAFVFYVLLVRKRSREDIDAMYPTLRKIFDMMGTAFEQKRGEAKPKARVVPLRNRGPSKLEDPEPEGEADHDGDVAADPAPGSDAPRGV